MTEWTIGAVLDAIADSVPDRLMTVCGERRSTFGETAERTRRLANFLAGKGFGVDEFVVRQPDVGQHATVRVYPLYVKL